MEHIGSLLGKMLVGVDRWGELMGRGFHDDGAGAWHRGDGHLTERAMFRMSEVQWLYWLEVLD